MYFDSLARCCNHSFALSLHEFHFQNCWLQRVHHTDNTCKQCFVAFYGLLFSFCNNLVCFAELEVEYSNFTLHLFFFFSITITAIRFLLLSGCSYFRPIPLATPLVLEIDLTLIKKRLVAYNFLTSGLALLFLWSAVFHSLFAHLCENLLVSLSLVVWSNTNLHNTPIAYWTSTFVTSKFHTWFRHIQENENSIENREGNKRKEMKHILIKNGIFSLL